MALNLAAADAVLKDLYLPTVREQLNEKCRFLQQIERNQVQVEGRQFILATHIGRNSGIGARADGGTLPTAGAQQYVDAKGTPKHIYGVFQITGPTIRAMKSDKGSFLRAIESETKGNTNDLKRDVNRQLWGTSDGVIATAGTTAGTQPVQLAATTSNVQMAQLEVGMVVDLVTFSGGVATPITNGTAVKITAKDAANLTITTNGGNVTTTSATKVVRNGAGGSGASQVEVTGVQTIADTTSGSVHGIDPATYPTWVPYVDTAGANRSISEGLIEKAMQTVEFNTGEEVNLLMSNYGVQRAVSNVLTSMKRFTNTVDLKGGYKGLEINAGGVAPAALMTERDAPANKLFGFSTSHWYEATQSDWEFMQEDGGGILQRFVGTADAYVGVMYKDMELLCDERASAFTIEALSES